MSSIINNVVVPVSLGNDETRPRPPACLRLWLIGAADRQSLMVNYLI
jgi:hypothetical protein